MRDARNQPVEDDNFTLLEIHSPVTLLICFFKVGSLLTQSRDIAEKFKVIHNLKFFSK